MDRIVARENYLTISIYLLSFAIFILTHSFKRIGGLMVSLLASSAVDRWFEPRSGQTKDNSYDLVTFFSGKALLTLLLCVGLIHSSSLSVLFTRA